MTHSVSVRTLAETYFEGGDLKSNAEALERMQEGLKGHLLIQNAYDARYKAEVPVKHEVTVDGVSLLVQGRVDGLRLEQDLCEVEEIKTTPVSPALIGENDYPVHWAQAQIYAWILCQQNGLDKSTVRLVYANLEGERVCFCRVYPASELTRLFFTYAAEYAARVKREESWLTEALPSVRQSAFPFDSFRSGQRSFAAAAYRAIQHKTRLLAQAPTGIGKTAAALFPAVKALGEGLTDTVFYLTARTTGRAAAENALELMRKRGMRIRSVSIVAQRKLCPTPLLPCDPELCPRARGHFDRQRLAVSESWQIDALNEAAIQALAEKYSVCPFELTLALCETAQVVICDYNYVFDPKVRLKRFFDRSGRYTLLIDEAHNLMDRAREMYSAILDGQQLRALKSALAKNGEKGGEVYSALQLLIKRIGKTDEFAMDSQLPGEIIEAAKRFTDAAKPLLGGAQPYAEQLRQQFFDALSFIRMSDLFDEESYRAVFLPGEAGQRASCRLWCYNPTPLLSRITRRMRGTVMFSATLQPLEHYGKMLGVEEQNGDALLDLPSPFPKENLFCAALSIPTRYQARQESAGRVARALKALVDAKTGNYLACFPSHAYMNLVAEAFSSIAGDTELLVQKRDMSEKERARYLARFKPAPERSMLAFIAMGGVFSEGVDLPGDRLIGAAIVGVGMPQICAERNALMQLFTDEEGEGGFETAYLYPGLGKCLQAAGRVIRGETDRGAVLFIDERYFLPQYARLLPPHMKPVKLDEARLGQALDRFWNTEDS